MVDTGRGGCCVEKAFFFEVSFIEFRKSQAVSAARFSK